MKYTKENLIIEQRTLEAVQKNLMGIAGKIGVISRFLGNEVRQQSGGLYEVNYANFDFYNENEVSEDDILTADEEDNSYLLGYHFDGLSRGFHIETSFLINSASLKVVFKGYKVYEEVSGNLTCYAPFPEWEEMIGHLYAQAEVKLKKWEDETREEKQKDVRKKSKTLLERLRMLWGI